MPALRTLSPAEARVLATLMEKARTVPDSYPMSLNALALGCNQKTTRDVVMNLSDAEVLAALDSLKDLSLVRESTGGRVLRYEHNFQRGVGVPEQSAVLLGLLMLRGPQTAAELRANAERWYRFADTSSVEAFLDELQECAEDKGGPLVVCLPRAPGSRESRWAHLLCGPVDQASLSSGAGGGGGAAASALHARVDALEQELASLRETVAAMARELGMTPPG
jgi:uncharacterized protein YceH (UPF0502 family)